MSATILRDSVRQALQQKMSEESGYLATLKESPFDQMRFRQGLIAGLDAALEILGNAYRAIHG